MILSPLHLHYIVALSGKTSTSFLKFHVFLYKLHKNGWVSPEGGRHLRSAQAVRALCALFASPER